MKTKKTLSVIILLIVVSCSSKKPEQGNPKIQLSPQSLSLEVYQPKTVCDCTDDGVKALKDILAIRQRYESIEEYNLDLIALKNVSLLNDNWKLIREKCLRKFATKLLTPTECNDPYRIREVKEKLDALKIRTS